LSPFFLITLYKGKLSYLKVLEFISTNLCVY
jgi:hypothetical protein